MGVSVPSRSTLLAAVAVTLVAVALVALSAGELLFAGLCMFATTFVIYLRETQA